MTLYLGLGQSCVKPFPLFSIEREQIGRFGAPNGANSPGRRVRNRNQDLGGVLLKSTVGAAVEPVAASKYVRALAPVTFAVSACGKVRM